MTQYERTFVICTGYKIVEFVTSLHYKNKLIWPCHTHLFIPYTKSHSSDEIVFNLYSLLSNSCKALFCVNYTVLESKYIRFDICLQEKAIKKLAYICHTYKPDYLKTKIALFIFRYLNFVKYCFHQKFLKEYRNMYDIYQHMLDVDNPYSTSNLKSFHNV
jgi:hypothetical protein